MSSPSNPTPSEIIALAKRKGFIESRPEVSSTLFFQESSPQFSMPPVRINVYHTTRCVLTHLNHPTQGTNELWRSDAYQTLEDLEQFFDNPRLHTGKGYRRAKDAIRGCVKCGNFKKRGEFSKKQWDKGPDANKCKDCVAAAVSSSPTPSSLTEEEEVGFSELSDAMEGVNLGDEYPSLSEDLLKQHDKKVGAGKQKLERRQFNCPECPKHGRGKHVFFKKVPVYKPVVKCPKCKRANRGKCERIYPVPKQAEKGYGHFKCPKCNDSWGSSRAIHDIGQACHGCQKNGTLTMVKPFRIGIVHGNKDNKGGITGGGARSRFRRVPREPIAEEAALETAYTEQDRDRNTFAAGNALAGGTKSYEYHARESTPAPSEVAPLGKVGVPAGYKHKCEGCSSGLCRSRYLPKSLVQDQHDGDTVSTSASIMTNSSIDKTDFQDRDFDFDDYEDENEEWHTVPTRGRK